MVVWIRRFRTVLYRSLDYATEWRWIVLGVSLATTGVVGIVWHVPAWVNVAGAVISIWLVGLEIFARTRQENQTQPLPRAREEFGDVRRALANNPRFVFLAAGVGTFLIDLVASREVAKGQVFARSEIFDFALSRKIRAQGRRFLRVRLAQTPDTYNGRVAGLNTNLGTGPTLPDSEWRITPARYWDHLSSDIFAMNDVYVAGEVQSRYGRALFVDRHGLPRDHGDSWLLNNIGTSVLALTTDFRLVLVSQSTLNESSRGMLAPSGSGSLEIGDFRRATRLAVRDLARNGALREMSEETGIPEGDVEATAFLGMGRWLDKAAMPELLTFAVLSVDSHALDAYKIPKSDRPYTLWVETCRVVQRPLNWKPLHGSDIVEAPVRHRLSLPLLAGLDLLARTQSDPSSAAGALVEKAFHGFRH